MMSRITSTVAATLLTCCLSVGATSAPARRPLLQWWSAERQDFWVVATDAGIAAAKNVFHYHEIGSAGYVMTKREPGTSPLELFWSERLLDNRNVADPTSIAAAKRDGYELKAIEGFVFASPRRGTQPLKLFWNAARSDSLTLAGVRAERSAHALGYRFVRTQGYVWIKS